MATVLEMPPYKKPTSFFPDPDDSANSLITNGFQKKMAKAMSALILHERVGALEMPRLLDQVFKNQLPLALRRTVEVESHRQSAPVRKLLEKAGLTAGELNSIDALSKLSLPDATLNSFRDAFSGRIEVIAELCRMKEIPVIGKSGCIFSLVKSVGRAFQESPANPLPKVAALLRGTLFNPDFTVPHDKSASLYFLSHLPAQIRWAVQYTLLSNNTADYLDKAVSDPANQGLAEGIALLKGLFQYRQFSSDHWGRLLMNHNAPAELVLEAGQEARKVERLLVNLAGVANAEKVLDLFSKFGAIRRKAVYEHSRLFDAEFLQAIDTGHCFPGYDTDLMSVTNRVSFPRSFKKDGRFAAIFEDEPAQASAYRKMIQDCTQLEVPADRFCTSSPEQILRLVIAEPRIGFFLLDISQPQDSFAGIRLAKQLIELLSRCYPPLPKEEDPSRETFVGPRPRKVRVVIWSSAPELVKAADEEIERILEQEAFKDRVVRHCGGGNGRVEVSAHLKSSADFFRWL